MATGEVGSSNLYGFGKVLQKKVTRTKGKVKFCSLWQYLLRSNLAADQTEHARLHCGLGGGAVVETSH